MTSNQTQQHVVFCQIYHKGADFKARFNVRTPCCTQSFLLSIPPSPKRPSGLTLNRAVVQPRWIVGEIPQMQWISVTRICGLDIAWFMITTDWTWMPYVKCVRDPLQCERLCACVKDAFARRDTSQLFLLYDHKLTLQTRICFPLPPPKTALPAHIKDTFMPVFYPSLLPNTAV